MTSRSHLGGPGVGSSRGNTRTAGVIQPRGQAQQILADLQAPHGQSECRVDVAALREPFGFDPDLLLDDCQ
jgi:hypothetical protein